MWLLYGGTPLSSLGHKTLVLIVSVAGEKDGESGEKEMRGKKRADCYEPKEEQNSLVGLVISQSELCQTFEPNNPSKEG